MSECDKDVLALVSGTLLALLVWLAIGGATYRLSPGTAMGFQRVGAEPASAAMGTTTAGPAR